MKGIFAAKFFDAKGVQSQSAALHNIVETTICLNAKTEALQAHIQSKSLISSKAPLQTYQNLKLTHLKTTPNKQPLELQQYSQDISIICAFMMAKDKLIKEIGKELAEELSSVHTINPPVWTSALDKYIDNIINKSKNDFKRAVLDNPDTGDELFKLYCEKSHAHSAKMVKSSKCSEIVQVDAKATRYLNGLNVWHMEVAGPSDNATNNHIVNDTRKSLHTDFLNLIMILRNHLDCDVSTAMKIKNKIAKQETLMDKINKYVLQSNGNTVREVLKIPDLE
ncbi:hypothetical protein C2G38_2156758 [Gigaspora rosea]|uniref:Uncharacterized protein n=1 Tax=Gigaspora rosea TaxID=44941 RepID=A0A397W5R1_9GLOM|nr:hypothetical protein C2G38_2156758 [Gigaspora rosea]